MENSRNNFFRLGSKFFERKATKMMDFRFESTQLCFQVMPLIMRHKKTIKDNNIYIYQLTLAFITKPQYDISDEIKTKKSQLIMK